MDGVIKTSFDNLVFAYSKNVMLYETGTVIRVSLSVISLIGFQSNILPRSGPVDGIKFPKFDTGIILFFKPSLGPLLVECSFNSYSHGYYIKLLL